jgi:hypothetical protein
MMQGRNRTIVLSVFSIALLMPAAARAAASPGPTDAERAKQLRARAEALFDQPKEWRKAAKLLEASAALRSADDAEAYECLLSAARIRAATGDAGVSKKLFKRAAEHALARGIVMDAAQAYVFAAFAAKQARDVNGATELLERARLLTGSPQLSEHERRTLLAYMS